MKFDLIIKDASAANIAAVFAALGQTATAIAATQAVQTIATSGDDEDENTTGDVVAQPGQIDGRGFPWDERIHSTPATLTDKGVWRAKRGVKVGSPLNVQVETELKSRGYGNPAQPAAPVQQPAPVAAAQPAPQYQPQPVQPVPYQPPMPSPQAEYQPQFQHQPAPQPVPVQQFQPQPVPVQQPAPVAPQAVPAPGSIDFPTFMGRIQAGVNTAYDSNYLNTVCQRVGAAFNTAVNSIMDVQGNQQMLDYFVQIMAQEGRWV